MEGWARTAAARARMAVVYFMVKVFGQLFDEARLQFGGAVGNVR